MPREGGAAVPAELSALTEKALPAVNARDFAALSPLAQNAEQDFAWIKETSTKKWEAGVLLPPNPKGEAQAGLAIFHAWHTCESDGDHFHLLRKTDTGWQLGAELPEREPGSYRVRDHALTVSLDPTKKRASLSDRVRIERTGATLAPYVLLRLSDDFKVEDVRRDSAKGARVPFQQIGGALACASPTDRAFTFYLRYAGQVNHRGSDYILENEATLNSYWYPHIARLPATATVTVTAPPGWTPIAQGKLLSQKHKANGAITATFRNDIPTCYFTVDAGRYAITSRKVADRTLSVYLLNNAPDLAKRCLDLLQNAIAFFDKNFAPYPYPRYTVVETHGPFGGALEGYSLATFGPGTLPGTIVHELSHTWWGGIVPCAYTRSMWNESFADYSDGLFQRLSQKREGGGEFGGMLGLRRGPQAAQIFAAFPMTMAHDTSDGRQSAVGYGKGALVLRVLEDELGQETMLKCLQAFVKERKRGEAAEWSDFEAVVARVSGKDLRWFFAQWAERAGLPNLHMENVTMRTDGSQTVVEADLVQEGEPYRLHLPVVLEVESGAPLTRTIEIAEPRTHLELRVLAPAKTLMLDPKGTLPLVLPATAKSKDDALSHSFVKTAGKE